MWDLRSERIETTSWNQQAMAQLQYFNVTKTGQTEQHTALYNGEVLPSNDIGENYWGVTWPPGSLVLFPRLYTKISTGITSPLELLQGCRTITESRTHQWREAVRVVRNRYWGQTRPSFEWPGLFPGWNHRSMSTVKQVGECTVFALPCISMQGVLFIKTVNKK